jgi:hypothetical protein
MAKDVSYVMKLLANLGEYPIGLKKLNFANSTHHRFGDLQECLTGCRNLFHPIYQLNFISSHFQIFRAVDNSGNIQSLLASKRPFHSWPLTCVWNAGQHNF